MYNKFFLDIRNIALKNKDFLFHIFIAPVCGRFGNLNRAPAAVSHALKKNPRMKQPACVVMKNAP